MQGTIERRDGKAIWINGERFSAFVEAMIEANVGDYVDFEYTEKNGVGRTGNPVVYKNIKGKCTPAVVSGAHIGTPYAASFSAASTAPRAAAAASSAYTPKAGEPVLSKDRLILRQNALTAAVNRCNVSHPDADANYIISMAKEFEAYTSGDADLEAAKAMLESSEK
jgi:hypothetical protein